MVIVYEMLFPLFLTCISVGDWPTFHISKLICKGQLRVNDREIKLTAL